MHGPIIPFKKCTKKLLFLFCEESISGGFCLERCVWVLVWINQCIFFHFLCMTFCFFTKKFDKKWRQNGAKHKRWIRACNQTNYLPGIIKTCLPCTVRTNPKDLFSFISEIHTLDHENCFPGIFKRTVDGQQWTRFSGRCSVGIHPVVAHPIMAF